VSRLPPSGSFEDALDEAGRSASEEEADASRSGRAPGMRASVDFWPVPLSGGGARFELALDWVGEPRERPTRPPAPLRRPEIAPSPADASAEIARELGVGEALMVRELERRWRSFLWRNHPDRQPPDERARANARVAIANALYERARRELVGR
jgi:hypothetical protein